MGEETTGSAVPATGVTTAEANKSTSDAMTKVMDTLDKLAKRVESQASLMERWGNEVGEIRKLAGTKAETSKEAPTVDMAKKVDEVIQAEQPFDFTKLSPQEQDIVTVYMREHLGKLPPEEKKIAKEALRDMKNFNELAKGIAEKFRTPKHLEAVLGEEPVKEKASVQTEVMSELRAMLKLADSEKTSAPPGGGSSKGTVVRQPATQSTQRKFPNGGIMSMTT